MSPASNQADLKFLSDLMAEGKVTPFVEKTYSLDQTADALRYFEEGHARGKLVDQDRRCRDQRRRADGG